MTKRMGGSLAVMVLLAMTIGVASAQPRAEPELAMCGAGGGAAPYPEPGQVPASMEPIAGCAPPPCAGCEPLPPPPCGGCAPGQVPPMQLPLAPAPEAAAASPLTAEDLATLGRAPVSGPSQTLAVLTGLTFGFGLGHAYQDRYDEDGRFFTITEGLSAAVVLTGAFLSVDLDDDRRELGGKLALYGGLSWALFHAWGAIDVMTYNARLRRRSRALNRKLGVAAAPQPYLAPSQLGSGATAGVAFGF
jgi:hypothetical protein